MEMSNAHKFGMNLLGNELYPDGLVPWRDAESPDIEKGHNTGRLRGCSYCGSMHPADVATAIRVGAIGEWADRKYGWPHKAYFTGVPNPHAGMQEIRDSANYKVYEDWIRAGPKNWHEPGTPAPETTYGKFYTVHLLYASPEEKETIEKHLGFHFDFTDDGKVSWRPIE
ncbi:MAG: hypothetical protein A2029_01395 [Chloroflexi bacterium RBG_19FT_COMBO_47_9]|nr:MAG: hypothetical protein A2029_01395 [Chloroflexi bacterium RBG_19FT_COMBO_47_9]